VLFLNFCQREKIESFEDLTNQKKGRKAARHIAGKLRENGGYPDAFRSVKDLPSASEKQELSEQSNKVSSWLKRPNNRKTIQAHWDANRDEKQSDSSHPEKNTQETPTKQSPYHFRCFFS
jgi:hypothetical protein